ncbi:MAG: divergent PAP2 family protein [bacterium]
MQFITDGVTGFFSIIWTILSNRIFWSCFTIWFTAQAIKFIWYFIKFKKINFRLLVGTGGMPSSHTAFVTGLTTTIGLLVGWNTPEFMITLGFSIVVISDAVGVRRAAGKQATTLNKIVEDFYKNHSEELPERLKEFLGHTPMEAAMGLLLGLVMAIMING